MAATTAQADRAADRREQILVAFLAEAADYGFTRISMESIAKRVGISRAQLYKYFSNRDELAETALAAELADVLGRLSATLHTSADARTAVATTVAQAVQLLRAHPIVDRLLRTEREVMMRHLRGDEPTLLTTKAWIEAELSTLSERTSTAINISEAAEFIMRTVISMLVSPQLGEDTTGDDELAGVIERWLLPGVFSAR